MAREASVAQESFPLYKMYNLPKPTTGDFDELIYKGATIADIQSFLDDKKITPKSLNNAIIYAIVLKDIIPAKSEQFEEICKFILKMPDLRFADLKLINDSVKTIIPQQGHSEEAELKLQYLNNQALIYMIRANEIAKVYETLNNVDSIKIQKKTFFHALAYPFIADFFSNFSKDNETEYNNLIEEAQSLITKLFEKADAIIFAPESGFLEHLETESLKRLNHPKKASIPDYVFSKYLENTKSLKTLLEKNVTRETSIAL